MNGLRSRKGEFTNTNGNEAKISSNDETTKKSNININSLHSSDTAYCVDCEK